PQFTCLDHGVLVGGGTAGIPNGSRHGQNPLGFQHMATIQSFEHSKTSVVTAVFGVLATLGFWFGWAAVTRKTALVQIPLQ
ncbi:MAG: hypothetical protein AB8B42_04175, partial [Prochlorococcus sp.]